jgi:ribonuclease HI
MRVLTAASLHHDALQGTCRFISSDPLRGLPAGRQCVGIPSPFSPMLLSLMIMSGSPSEKSPSASLEVYTDGASRGNPGPAAYGFIFVKNDEIILEESKTIGKTTNNTAEYYAIISALTRAQEFARESVTVCSDSELVIKQINNQYRITKPHLVQLRAELATLQKKFRDIRFRNVPREHRFIRRCDELCNQALDRETKG